ncbi:MAG: transposase [Paracoccaceae bacterium]
MIELYAAEKEARGQPTDERVALWQTKAEPILDDLKRWLQAQLLRIPGHVQLSSSCSAGRITSPKR